jgi:hypothetical protein
MSGIDYKDYAENIPLNNMSHMHHWIKWPDRNCRFNNLACQLNGCMYCFSNGVYRCWGGCFPTAEIGYA